MLPGVGVLGLQFLAHLGRHMHPNVVLAVGGLVLSAALSFRVTVAPGPTIVLLALAMFTATWPLGVWLRRRSRLSRED